MNINLENLNACEEGIRWFKDFKNPDHEAVVKQLMVENRFEWANWLIPRLFDDRDDCINYAVGAVSMVVDSYVLDMMKIIILQSKSLKEIGEEAYKVSWVSQWGGPVSCALWCASEPELKRCAAWATHAGTSVSNRDESFNVPIINYGLELLNGGSK